MTERILDRDGTSEAADWRGLYRTASAAALAGVGLILVDMGLTAAGGDAGVGQRTAVEWFTALQSDPFLGLRNLGLFNVINIILAVPLYLALYRAHRVTSPAAGALALLLCLLSAAVYGANNRALTMLSLSSQYAAAATDAQRSLLAMVGSVVLTQAEDFTPASFLGLLLSSLASLLVMVVMLRGSVFRRWVGLVGFVGSAALLVFTVCVTFVPQTFDLAMIFAMVGGLLSVAWQISVGLGMFRLAREMTLVGNRQAGSASYTPVRQGLDA